MGNIMKEYEPLTRRKLKEGVTSPSLRTFFSAIPFITKILKLDTVNKVFEACEGKKDMDFVDGVLNHEDVDIHAEISDEDLAKIPQEGAFIAMITHHGGISDVAAIEAIGRVRRDIKVLGMGFVTELTENVSGVLIKVEKMAKRNDDQRNEIRIKSIQALDEGHVLVLMGSGTGAYKTKKGRPVDKPWKEGGPRFAIEQMLKGGKGFPVLPMHVEGKNDWWYYLLRSISKAASMPLYIRQFLKRKGKKFEVKIGEMIMPEFLCQEFADRIAKIREGDKELSDSAAEKLAYKSIAQLIRKKAYEAAGIKDFC
jgi:putative hemolysin